MRTRRRTALLGFAWLVIGAAALADPPLEIGEPRAPEPFTLEQRLLDAARRGDVATALRALDKGAPLGAKDEAGRGALLLAARDAGSLELVKQLHARGAPVDEPDATGRAALSWVAAEGRLELVQWLVERKAQVDRADVDRRTPLFYAAAGGHLEVARLLLGRGGADPNAPDRFGDTPLMVACIRGQDAMAELLLARGADPARRNQEGKTPAERAAPNAPHCLGQAPRSGARSELQVARSEPKASEAHRGGPSEVE